MYRFFLYFQVRANAEQAAEFLRHDFTVWDIRPGWDDPFFRLEVRRELATAELADAIEQLEATASRFDGEYSGHEICDPDPKKQPERPS